MVTNSSSMVLTNDYSALAAAGSLTLAGAMQSYVDEPSQQKKPFPPENGRVKEQRHSRVMSAENVMSGRS